MVGLGGLEPPTSRLSSARSNQLSYKPLNCAINRLTPTRRKSRKVDRPSRLVPRPRGAPGQRPMRRASASQSHSLKKEKRRRQTRLRYARQQTDCPLPLFQVFQKAEASGEAFPLRNILRKEVIQPQVPLRLPCYDFTPVADPTVVACFPCGLAQRLRVKPTPMV